MVWVMTMYTIGQIADRSGFSASALRYYDQHGLIEPVDRSESGYRLYDETSLARLEFIDRAKQLGCTLEEITDLAALWEAHDCGPVQARLHELVTDKIADAQRRSTNLIRFIAQLETAAAHLGGEAVDGPCSDGCACLGGRSESTESIPVMLGERAEPTIACTLGAVEIGDRMEDWQAILAHVTGREQTADGGLRLTLSAAVPLAELSGLVAAEQGCCGFFAFAITVDGRGVALEVRAPDDAGDIVTTVFGAAA